MNKLRTKVILTYQNLFGVLGPVSVLAASSQNLRAVRGGLKCKYERNKTWTPISGGEKKRFFSTFGKVCQEAVCFKTPQMNELKKTGKL